LRSQAFEEDLAAQDEVLSARSYKTVSADESQTEIVVHMKLFIPTAAAMLVQKPVDALKTKTCRRAAFSVVEGLAYRTY
jgi:hypothetical protein